MDPMLPKYIRQSLSIYFQEVVDDLPLAYYVEGIEEPTKDKFQRDSCALKVNGPILFEGSQGVEWYKLEVHLLLTDLMHETKDNGFGIYEWAGTLQEALRRPIRIFAYAENEQDDVLLGCLQPDPAVRKNIRVVDYELQDKDVRVRQVSVHGKFMLCI